MVIFATRGFYLPNNGNICLQYTNEKGKEMVPSLSMRGKLDKNRATQGQQRKELGYFNVSVSLCFVAVHYQLSARTYRSSYIAAPCLSPSSSSLVIYHLSTNIPQPICWESGDKCNCKKTKIQRENGHWVGVLGSFFFFFWQQWGLGFR